MSVRSTRRLARRALVLIAIVAVVAAVAAGVSAIMNRRLLAVPTRTGVTSLSDIDKAHLAEARQLQRELGDEVWPGWRHSEAPLLVSDGTNDFLIGLDGQPRDWTRAGDGGPEGGRVFRRPTKLVQDQVTEIEGRPVAVVRTKESTDRLLVEEMHEELPGLVAEIFPYAVLKQPTEAHLADVIHSLFHAHVASEAPERFAEANVAYWSIGGYPLGSSELRAASQAEIDTLLQALQSDDDEEAAASAREFLAIRDERREHPQLDSWAIDVERKSEWLKGLAKYVEQATLRLASERADYRSVDALAADPDFCGYTEYDDTRNQLVSAMHHSVDQGRVMRFHYTGMAQAELLDRLSPGWKERAFGEGVYLEDMLREAVAP